MSVSLTALQKFLSHIVVTIVAIIVTIVIVIIIIITFALIDLIVMIQSNPA